MATTLCTKLLPKQVWTPLSQSVRHGSKAVTRHRKPVHILRQKLLAVTQYIPPRHVIPRGAYPEKTNEVQQDSSYVVLLKRSLKKLFEENRMIAVVQNSASTAEDMILLKNRLFKHGITVKLIPNQVTRSFLKDSIYSNLAPLFIGPTVLFVSKEPKVSGMLSALRSSPQMTLLGACIDNKLLSVEGIISYSKLPSMTVVQGELVSGLTMLTSRTAMLLQHQPAHLCALLQQHIKQQSPESSSEGESTAQEAT